MGICAEVLTVDGVDVLAFANARATSSTVSRCWSSRYGHSAVRSDRLLNASMAACVSPPVPPPPGKISLSPVYIGGSSSPCGVAWAAMPEPVGACSRVFTGFFCAPVLLWHPVFACVLPPVLPPESYGRHLGSSGWGIVCLFLQTVSRVAPSAQSSV